MLKVNIDHRRLDRKMRKLAARGKDPSPLMRQVAGDMMDSTEENFAREGRPRWPSLSSMTQDIRSSKGKAGKMLQVSAGGLAASMSSKYTSKTAVVGSNKKYAKYIQYGTEQRVTKKQRFFLGMTFGVWMKVGQVIKMPPRPFLKLTNGDLRQIRRRIGRFFSGK